MTADRIVESEEFPARAAAVLRSGGKATTLHLRSRSLGGRRLFELALELAEVAREAGSTLTLNDRVDVALATGVGRVHLGSASLPVSVARSLLPEGSSIGRSVHSVDEVRAEVGGDPDTTGVDYWMAGNVFRTGSHPGREARGAGWLASVVAAADRPVVAVGGITPERVRTVVSSGAVGVAILSGIWDSGDPARATSHYLEKLNASSSSDEIMRSRRRS